MRSFRLADAHFDFVAQVCDWTADRDLLKQIEKVIPQIISFKLIWAHIARKEMTDMSSIALK